MFRSFSRAATVASVPGVAVRRVPSLGSTVAFDALAAGDLDVYVDYSGTIWATILGEQALGVDRDAVLAEVGAHTDAFDWPVFRTCRPAHLGERLVARGLVTRAVPWLLADLDALPSPPPSVPDFEIEPVRETAAVDIGTRASRSAQPHASAHTRSPSTMTPATTPAASSVATSAAIALPKASIAGAQAAVAEGVTCAATPAGAPKTTDPGTAGRERSAAKADRAATLTVATLLMSIRFIRRK